MPLPLGGSLPMPGLPSTRSLPLCWTGPPRLTVLPEVLSCDLADRHLPSLVHKTIISDQ